MSVAGLDVAGARVFGALCGLATVAIVTFLAVRHFGWRAGLLAGTLLSFTGGAIQFSRVTTCATPTQTLWALSAAGFLEAARRGRAWAWALRRVSRAACRSTSTRRGGSGVSSPSRSRSRSSSARRRGTRARTAAGVVFAALAALVAAGPFLAATLRLPGEFTVRAQETTIFIPRNAARLAYVRPEWGIGRVLVAQVEHAVGFLNRYVDQNIFWPTDRPLFPPVLAALTLLGILAATVKARDVRLLLVSLWFWIGILGVIVTVETPNMHRWATAIPVLPAPRGARSRRGGAAFRPGAGTREGRGDSRGCRRRRPVRRGRAGASTSARTRRPTAGPTSASRAWPPPKPAPGAGR